MIHQSKLNQSTLTFCSIEEENHPKPKYLESNKLLITKVQSVDSLYSLIKFRLGACCLDGSSS